MLLVELNEKIKAIRIPENFEDFKKKVKEEYSISEEKMSQIFFTYIDEENNSIYVDNEEDYIYAIPFVETIVFNVEFKENDDLQKGSSIDSLLSKGNIDAIIEKANKRIIELKNEKHIIKNEENKLKTKNKEIPIIHEGINCNECKNIVKGIRYKCCICLDYNLCEKCESKLGYDHHHPFLKIRKPELCPIKFYCSLKK